MSQTYKIDQARINNIRNRAVLRSCKLLGFVIVLIIAPQLLNYNADNLKAYGFSILFTTSIYFLIFTISLRKMIKSYRNLEIILSKSGVELKADMMAYKKIDWANLKIEDKPNGFINLYDTTISPFIRKMTGKGWIQIQPEILGRDLLLKEMLLRSGEHQ